MSSYWNLIFRDVPIVEFQLAEIPKHENIRFDQTKISKITYVVEPPAICGWKLSLNAKYS